MVFWEFVKALFALDLAWFAGLIANNLFFLFAFVCVAHIIYEKKTLFYTLVVTGLIWITGDFSQMFGWTAPYVPVAFLLGRLCIRSLSAKGFVGKNMTLTMTTAYYIVFTLMNTIVFQNDFVFPWQNLPLLGLLMVLATATIHFIDIKTSDEEGVLNRR